MSDTIKARGNPSKGFFINMITRDISLVDSILDLLDNSVDGINRTIKRTGPLDHKYSGFDVSLQLTRSTFEIKDNCGGIPIGIAKDYAFRFGRPDDQVDDNTHSIGLYGIGMKRALFKMGKKIDLISSTGSESFRLDLEVDKWRRQKPENDWDFKLIDVVRQKTTIPKGTAIKVSHLHEGIKKDFDNPTFANSLRRAIQRDYAFILQKGLSVTLNGTPISPIMPTFKASDELAPMRIEEKIGGVSVEITAGLSSPPPDDDSAEMRMPDADIYGWYIVCNDRVIVTADKTALTGWNTDEVPSWHNQYYGFLGIARFDSDQPELLPWKTTKRDVDPSSTVYSIALAKMKRATVDYTDYTNQRKSEMKRVREIEKAAQPKPLYQITKRSSMKLPTIENRELRQICYDKPVSEIEAAARALGLKRASARAVGMRTFDYFLEHEGE